MATLGKYFYGNFGFKHVFKDILRDGIKRSLGEPNCRLLENERQALMQLMSVIPGELSGWNATEQLASYFIYPKKFK